MFATILTDRQADRDNSVNFSYFKNSKGLKALLAHANSVFCVLYV